MKHLIFDAGGVLVYPRLGTWDLPLRAAEILGPERAATIESDRFRAANAACQSWLREDRFVRDMDMERQLRLGYALDLDRRMGWRLTDAEINALADDFTENTDRYGFFADVRDYLVRWKPRFRLGLLSDTMPSLYPVLARYGILGLFDATVISAHVGATKPDPRMYAAILRALDARPEDCLFVDDRPRNLEGAARAGIRVVQLSRPEFPAARLWDGPVARDFAELDAMLGEVFA